MDYEGFTCFCTEIGSIDCFKQQRGSRNCIYQTFLKINLGDNGQSLQEIWSFYNDSARNPGRARCANCSREDRRKEKHLQFSFAEPVIQLSRDNPMELSQRLETWMVEEQVLWSIILKCVVFFPTAFVNNAKVCYICLSKEN